MKKNAKRQAKSFFPKKQTFTPGIVEDFLDSIFSINKSEKNKIMSLLEKHNIQSLLFYTNAKNLENILKNGIVPLKNLKLIENEVYYVWSFFQHDESIDLELDTSSRAHFWKWISDLDFDPKAVVVIGINPNRLNKLTRKDWLLDRLQNLINISEKIYVETFDWILVQDIQVFKKTQKYLNKHEQKIDLYYGNDGVVKIQKQKPENEKPVVKNPHVRKEPENE